MTLWQEKWLELVEENKSKDERDADQVEGQGQRETRELGHDQPEIYIDNLCCI